MKGGPPARRKQAQLQMKFRHISYLMIGLLPFGAMSQPVAMPPTTTTAVPPNNAPPAEAPDKAQFSYALGFQYGVSVTNSMLRNQPGLDPKVDLDLSKFIEALANAISGGPITMSTNEVKKLLDQETAYQKQQVQEETRKLEAMGPENKAKGEKFMDEIGAKAGVTKLASGVVYEVIKEGAGEKPASNDVATLTMKAILIDGTDVLGLDHRPISISEPALPPGIREVLPMMKAGSHWMVYLPYLQAFGEKPAFQDARHGFKIGPYSAMIFDVELESFKAGPPPRATLPRRGGPTPPPPGVTANPQSAPAPDAAVSMPVTSSGIVRVPSAAEAERGEKPHIMTDAEVEAAKQEAAKQAATNAAAPK
jgi:FKBP-type peptidyl-prolyl cis-trans isomerase